MTSKRRRIVTTKPSKGACRTCRIRRIKCDQSRPNCQKCLSTGRDCDGYSPGTLPHDEALSNRPLLPSIRAQPNSSLTMTLQYTDGKLHITDHERNAFEYFVREMAAPLARISQAPDWIPFALQVGAEQPAIFYAVVAVGSGATAQTQITHHSLTRLRFAVKDNLALHQYCKATASLQRYVDLAVLEDASIGPVLLCCLLFVVYELMRGENSLAASHLRHGRKTLQSVGGLSPEKKNPIRPYVAWSQQLSDELLSTIDRFQLGSPALESWKPPAANSDRPSSTPLAVNLPKCFGFVEQAKETLDNIVADTSRWREEVLRLTNDHIDKGEHSSFAPAVQFCLAHCVSRAIDLGLTTPLAHKKTELLQSHRTWLSTIGRLENEQYSRSLQFMKIQHFVTYFTLATSRDTSETPTDYFENEFIRILSLISQYLNDAAAPPPILKSPIDPEDRLSFSLEYGILPALYLISLKCRMPSLRHRALALLRTAQRREGSHWSGELSTYAESIVRLEEARAREVLSDADGGSSELSGHAIPEAARFSDVVIEGLGYQRIRAVCCRYQHGGADSVEIVELSGSGVPPLHLRELRRLTFPVCGSCQVR